MTNPYVGLIICLILIIGSDGEKRDLTVEEVSSVRCFQNPASVEGMQCLLRNIQCLLSFRTFSRSYTPLTMENTHSTYLLQRKLSTVVISGILQESARGRFAREPNENQVVFRLCGGSVQQFKDYPAVFWRRAMCQSPNPARYSHHFVQQGGFQSI